MNHLSYYLSGIKEGSVMSSEIDIDINVLVATSIHTKSCEAKAKYYKDIYNLA